MWDTTTWVAQATPVSPNLLLNGGFMLWQRQAPGTGTLYAGGAYCADRWYVLGSGSPVQLYAQQIAGSGAIEYAGQLTQMNGSAQRCGLVQVLEAADSIPLRGKTVTCNFQVVGLPAGSNLRAALCEWTGTADQPAKALVGNWSSSTYSVGNFFNGATTTVAAVSPSIIASGPVSLTATVSASCNNLYVIVWTESAIAQAAFWSISQADLYIGNTSRTYTPRPFSQEFAMCRRYYEKSNGLAYAPGTSWGSDNTGVYGIDVARTSCSANSTYYSTFSVLFGTPKRVAPTVTFWNPATGTASSFIDNTNGHNITGTTLAINSSIYGITSWSLSSIIASISSLDVLYYNYSADAELGV